MRALRCVLVALLVVPASACGYLRSKDVGDEYVQAARVAIVEVLAGAGYSTRTGPDCSVSEDATSMNCTATTTTSASVEAHAEGGDTNDLEAAQLTVDVGGDNVYTGSIAAVLTSENE